MAVSERIRIETRQPVPSAALERARQIATGELRPGALPAGASQVAPVRLSALLRDGVLSVRDLPAATDAALGPPERRLDRLVARRIVAPEPLYRVIARETGFGLADLSGPADVRLIDALGASFCLVEGVLPWRRLGRELLVVVSSPEVFLRHRARLEAAFGRVLPALAPAGSIATKIRAARGPELARRAELRVAADLSCRPFPRLFSGQEAMVILGAAVLATLALKPLLAFATLVATASLLAGTLLKLAVFAASLTHRRAPAASPELPPPSAADALPAISIIVALYREADIAPRLIRRLGRLDYPKDKLDIVLVVEEEDALTRLALDRAALPPWMRVVVAPDGLVRTKPRALNFALDFCRGSLVGVYDAEDAPEPDQLRRVAAGFATAAPEVVCLQGMLDFYNPRSNWLARCFTLEYAAWFRAMLPGLERLGLPIPLGGTTLFFRREALVELGGWDAWNVTEDADLGLRLVRRGWRTAILPTTTHEEANCRALPWVRQRSRWLKGYVMTYLTHMRRPGVLWRDLGPRRFLGFQVLFLSGVLQGLLAPVLWTWWLLSLGLPHPLGAWLSSGVVDAAVGLFLAAEGANFALGYLGLRRSAHPISPAWLLTMPAYFVLQTLAAWKAIWEVLHLPFYWDKTHHGLFDGGI